MQCVVCVVFVQHILCGVSVTYVCVVCALCVCGQCVGMFAVYLGMCVLSVKCICVVQCWVCMWPYMGMWACMNLSHKTYKIPIWSPHFPQPIPTRTKKPSKDC